MVFGIKGVPEKKMAFARPCNDLETTMKKLVLDDSKDIRVL